VKRTPVPASDEEQSDGRIDTAALRASDVYPGVWEDEDDHEYVMTYDTDLRDWVLGVAARGNGVVTIVG